MKYLVVQVVKQSDLEGWKKAVGIWRCCRQALDVWWFRR